MSVDEAVIHLRSNKPTSALALLCIFDGCVQMPVIPAMYVCGLHVEV